MNNYLAGYSDVIENVVVFNVAAATFPGSFK